MKKIIVKNEFSGEDRLALTEKLALHLAQSRVYTREHKKDTISQRISLGTPTPQDEGDIKWAFDFMSKNEILDKVLFHLKWKRIEKI